MYFQVDAGAEADPVRGGWVGLVEVLVPDPDLESDGAGGVVVFLPFVALFSLVFE